MTRRQGFSIARPGNGIVLSQNNGALTGVIASWQYSATTTASNPGDGYIRFNNADPALATEIYISELDGQDNDLGSLLELFNGRNGLLQVESATRPNVVLFVEIETAVGNTGWRTLTIVDQHGGTGAFADLETVWLGFSFFGIQGNDLEIDAEGTLAERDAYDGESLGFIYASTDGDGDTITGTVLFRKLAGAGNWSVPIPIQGGKGNQGWAPTLAVVSDGERRVQQVTGYVGGEGVEPTDHVGEYLGAAGYVADIEDATDIRGGIGPSGADGTDGIDGTSLLTRVRVVDTTEADPGSAYEAGDTIDGVELAENDIVLRATSGGDIEDGFYVVPVSGGAARVAAFNSYDSMPGVYVSVMEGTTNADTLWRCTSDLGGALDTDPLVFEEFEGGGGTIPYTAASASGPASLDFAEDTDNGAHKIVLKAPASIAADANVTLPAGALDMSEWRTGQIKFPASQSASSDPNTLDDYEEGTWTPALTFATPGNLSIAYSAAVGTYTKKGREVTAAFAITTSSFTHTSASGSLRITGLPFTAMTLTGAAWTSVLTWAGITKANYTAMSAQVSSAENLMNVSASGSGQALSAVTAADMPTGGTVVLRGMITYFTD